MREKHSKARLEGVCKYDLWTTEELIEGYRFELDRINQDDANLTKKLIKAELKRRFDTTLKLLDNKQTDTDKIYKQLLNVIE